MNMGDEVVLLAMGERLPVDRRSTSALERRRARPLLMDENSKRGNVSARIMVSLDTLDLV